MKLYIEMSVSVSYLLLIDSRILDIPSITGALLPGVDYIVFDYAVDTYDTLKDKIIKNYASVGIVQHNTYSPNYSFLLDDPDIQITDIENGDPTLTTWARFIEFAQWLRDARGMQYLDLLACNLYSDPNWVYAITYIREQFGIHLRASLNITGDGGDFILESDNVNMIGIYFTDVILAYKYAFDLHNKHAILLDNSNNLWAWGLNTAGELGLGTTTNVFPMKQIPTFDNGTIQSFGHSSLTCYISYTNGNLYAAGSNQSHRLLANTAITGTTATSNVFVKADLFTNTFPNKVVAFSGSNDAGSYFFTTDGNVYSMGSVTNNQSPSAGMFGNTQLGTTTAGTVGVIYRMNNSTGKQIADLKCTAYSLVVKMSDGTIYFTGNGRYSGAVTTSTATLTKLALPNNELASQLECSIRHTGVITTTGNIYLVGSNQYAQINGTSGGTTPVSTWTQLSTSAIGKTPKFLSLSNTTTIVLFNDGTLYGIGTNSSGQFGLGHSNSPVSSLTQIPIPYNEPVVQVKSYDKQTIVLTSTGNVYGCGHNQPNFISIDYANNAQILSMVQLKKNVAGANVFVTNVKNISPNMEKLNMVTASSIPTISSVTVGLNKFTVVLNPVTNGSPGVTNYLFSLDSAFSTIAANLVSPNVTAVLSGLSNQQYTVYIKAISGSSWESPVGGFTGVPYFASSAPNIAVTSGMNSLSVAVTPSQNGYPQSPSTYYYSLNGGAYVNANTASSPIVISGLTAGTQYGVTMKAAFELTGNNIWMSPASAQQTNTPYNVPSAPTLSLVAGDSQMSLVFTASANGSPITQYKYSINNAAYVTVSADSFVSPYTITGLTNGQTYSVKLRAVNAAGESSDSSSVSVVPCGVPLGVTITSVSVGNASASVYISYQSNNGAEVTTYYYSFDGGNYVDASSSTLPIQLSNLQNGTNYTLTVKAKNSVGLSAASQSTSFMPYVPQTAAEAPTITSIVSGDKTLTVYFTDGSNNGTPILGYKYSVDGINYVWANETSSPIVINGLYNGQSYTVTMKTVSSAESAASNSITGTPDGSVSLSTPVILSTTTAESLLSATYDVPLNGASPSSVSIQYRLTTVSDGTYVDSSNISTGGVFSLSGIQLTAGVKYNLQIRAAISDGSMSSWSTAAVVYPPPVPALASYSQADKSISFTFSNVIDLSNVAGFKYKMDDSEYQWMDYIPSPTYTFTGLTNKSYNRNPTKEYTFKFKAVNMKGEESAEIGPYTLFASGPPETPVFKSMSIGDSSVSIYAVIGDAGSTEEPYYDYTTNDGVTYTRVIANADASGIVVYSVNSLTNGTDYSIRIRARNIHGASAWSLAYTAMPMGNPATQTITGITTSGTTALISVDQSGLVMNGPGNVLAYKYSLDGGNTYSFMQNIVSPLSLYGLTLGDTYSVKVKMVSTYYQESLPSDAYTFTIATVPDALTAVSATAGDQSLSTVVIPGSTGGSPITEYQYSLDGGSTFIQANTVALGNNQVQINIIGLVNGTTYSISVRAVNSYGNGVATPVSIQSATPTGTPSAPTITDVSFVSGVAYVSFTAGEENGAGTIVNYKYTFDAGETYKYTTGSTSPLSIAGLSYGTSYSIQIAAYTSMGVQGTLSDAVTFTASKVPDTPVITSIVPGDGSLVVTFIPGNVNGGSDTTYAYSLNGGEYTTKSVVSDPSNQLTMTITGLTNGTEYSVQLRQSSSSGDSEPTPVSSVYAPIGTPVTPTITDVSCVSGVVYVYFTAGAINGPGSIVTYKYTLDNGATFKYASGSSSPVAIRGLEYGTSYSIQIASYTSNNAQSAWSSSVSFVSTAVPDVPTVTSVTPGNQNITIEFIPGNSNGSSITGYEYSLDGTTYTVASTTDVSGGKLSTTISSLTNGTSYAFQLRAVNAVGKSASTLTSPSYIPYGTPVAPTITGVVCEPGTAWVSFTEGAVNGPGEIATYRYSLDSGVTYKFAEGHVSPIAIRDLSDGVSYTVQLVSYTTTGLQSSASNTYTFNTSGKPSAPVIVSATPGDGVIQLTVSQGSGEITGYAYALNGSSTFIPVSASGDQLTISGLTNGEPYSVAIQAINSIGNSELSIPSDIVIPYTIQNASQIISVNPVNGGLQVYMSNSGLSSILENNFVVTGYKYALDGNTFSGEVTTGNDDFIINGLTNGSTYTVAVKTITTAGITGKSNVVSNVKVYGAPSAPTIISAVPMSKKAVITFTDGSANGSPILRYKYRVNGGEILSVIANSSPATVFGLENGTSYTVELFAENAGGLSLPSIASSSFVPFDIPSAPVITEILPGNGCAYVYFDPINANGSAITALRYSLGAAAIDVSGITSPLTVPGLINKNTYKISIIAVNGAGQSAGSNIKTVIVGTPLPPVITSIVPGSKRLTINFDTSDDNGSAINMYSWALKGSNKLTKMAGLTSPIVCAGLNNGATYDIVIHASNRFGSSVASNSLGPFVPFDVPTKPTIASVIPMLNSALLTFVPPPSNGSPIIKYQYALNADTVFTDLSGLTSPVILPDMPNNVNYTVKMVAINAAGSSAVSASSKPAMYKYLPPGQIKVTSLVASYEQLTVNFVPPVANGAVITSYKYSLNGGEYVDTQSTVLPIVITYGIQNNTNYNISVVAVNSAGESVPSAPLIKPVSFVWLPPLAPIITGATTGNGTANIAFAPPATRGPPITGYSYSFDGGVTNYDLSGHVTSPIPIVGLTNDVSYNVTIAAMTSAGYSVRSAVRVVTPIYKAPAPPQIGTIVKLGDGGISVNFTPGFANGSPITTYKYTFDNGNTVVDSQMNRSPIVISGLLNQSYTIRLIATNALGDSVLSIAKTVLPPI